MEKIMKRPSISLTEEMHQKLENRMEKNRIKSLSECVREMLDLAFRVEEAAEKSMEKEGQVDLISEVLVLKNLLKNNLIWSLQSKMLSQFLVEMNPATERFNKVTLLEDCKRKATDHVNTLVENPT